MSEPITALPIPPKALNALWRGEAVVVPNDPTEKQVEDGRIAMSPEKFVSHMRVLDVYAAMLAASPYAKKE